ncbi:putative spermidine/putrescine transport system substrate-binding protein [Povalibacter uvarum]|uniref:Putative spermidine/putrescine transport system substrate-binding protein n=1 Tax=Povalibacter uvarum TaxID=732238 RepID=A0A841HJ78_9GAMM|nr:ABC transporter substrate-binding protein [Povalibacter uvarum]MBB6092085.1 putative spermidine/putrescine transport system substrate-binding protein [Povalibacter uvarum]
MRSAIDPSARLLLMASIALAVTACGKKEPEPPAATAPAATATAALEGQVDIVAWPGYIERGETDKNYDWVSKFETDTGCKVNVKTAGTSDEMVSLMTQGGYDLVTASGDASLRLIRGGTVQPVDVTRIPSYETLDPRLKEAPWHFVDGKHYGVPYQWGPNVLMYNTNVFKTAPTTWGVLFADQKLGDGKSNKGRIQAYDGPIYIADAALYLMSTKPDLGIKDPYELTEAQYTAALELLRGQHPLVQRYWHDANVQVQDFTNEGVVASSSWPFQVNTLVANKQPVASTVPAEGATGWADTTMLHTQAKHPNCAYKWMEWSISAKVQGDVASWFGSLPVVPAACNGNDLLGAEGCKNNGFENFDKIHFWRTPEARCATQGDACIPYSRWATDYVAIMGGR